MEKMIIIGSGLTFTLFIIALCYYGIIFGALLFLAITIFPTILILGSILEFISEMKKAKKGEREKLEDVDYVCYGFWLVVGIWFLVKITIPFLQSL